MFMFVVSVGFIIIVVTISALSVDDFATSRHDDVTPPVTSSHHAAVVGSSVNFVCSSADETIEPIGELSWYHSRSSSPRDLGHVRRRLDNNSSSANGRETITAVGKRRSELRVVDIQPEDEGVYECDLMTSVRSPDLIVERIDKALNRYQLAVLVGARSVQIQTRTSSESSSYKTIVFRCQSDGNPRPEYQWTNLLDSSIITAGPQYKVNISCTDHDETIIKLAVKCLAWNSVLSKEYLSDANVTVNVRTQKCRVSAMSRRPSFARSLGIYGATILSIWSTIGVIIILIRRSDRKRHHSVLKANCGPAVQECVYERVKQNESQCTNEPLKDKD